MSIWRCVYRQSLRLMFKVLVRCRWIPNIPAHQPGLDSSALILYVLPHRSEIDLLILQQYCLKNRLPDPFVPITHHHHPLPRYLFISDEPLRLSGKLSRQCSQQSADFLRHYLSWLSTPTLQHDHPPQIIQMVLVSLVWGRTPGYGVAVSKSSHYRWLNRLQKILRVVWFGRDTFIHLSDPLSLGDIADRFQHDQQLFQKLARLARIQLIRHYRMVTGPRLPKRQHLLNHLLQTKVIQEAITSEARNKQADSGKPDISKTTGAVMVMLNEVAAHFSYGFVRYANMLFTWLWHHLYQGITVHNAEQVRQCALDGDELIYLPCHRSHMDYLLLSFVLYNQGLVPPHIAAGINLNFWPMGSLFRRTGAFFIRRGFKGNKLYSTVFQEYLATLFAQGCSVEYFLEGGRSRTGRLLAPKTGLLSMSVQAMLRGSSRPVTLVPVYIGYEHVMEERTYAKERSGAVKQPENFRQLLRLRRDLRNLGRSYVNFGEPIHLSAYLDQQRPGWRQSITSTVPHRLNWLTPVVNQLAQKIMIDINKAVAVNAVNLCVTVLLAADQHQLLQPLLVRQLTCYLNLLHNIPYSTVCTVPTQSAEQLISQALKMKKLRVVSSERSAETIVALPEQQAGILIYYRNNIQHLLALPSLVANLLLNLSPNFPPNNAPITEEEITQHLMRLYPLLQADLFIDYAKKLPPLLQAIISELASTQLIHLIELPGTQGKGYCIDPIHILALQLLAANTHDLLQQYLIILSLLAVDPQLSRRVLAQRTEMIVQKIAQRLGNSALVLFDKEAAVTTLLRASQTVDPADDANPMGAYKLLETLRKTLPPERVKLIEMLTMPA